MPGTEILSPVFGVVTKLGFPYSDDHSFRYVEITDDLGERNRVFYIKPTVKKGDKVQADQTVIGIAQDISSRYRDPSKPPMKNHVHFEIIDADGNYINPEA